MKLYDIVHFQGHLWTVIGLEKTHCVATLLINDDIFGKMAFDAKSPGRYYGSFLEEYLRDFQLDNNFRPLGTYIQDEGCPGFFYLLSINEAKKLPRNVLHFKESWWLRSIGPMPGTQSYVDVTGPTICEDANKVSDKYAIRPAMNVRVEDMKNLGGIILPCDIIAANQDWSVE